MLIQLVGQTYRFAPLGGPTQPIASNDTISVAEGATAIIDVVKNDQYLGDKADLTVEIWNGSAWTNGRSMALGDVVVRSDKNIDFTAAAVPWNQTSFFDYRITDAIGRSNTARVTFTVVNVAGTDPVAAGNTFATLSEKVTTVLDVVANDTYVGNKADLIVQIWNGTMWTNTRAMALGTATVRSDNDINFTAAAVTSNQAGFFDYRIIDSNGISNTATVNFTVVNVPVVPVAEDDSFGLPELTAAVLDVVANDTYTGAKSALVVEIWNGTIWTDIRLMAIGTVTVRSDGDLGFAANAVSADTTAIFSYRITDSEGTSNTADVTMTVASVSTPPVAVEDTFEVNELVTTVLDVTANDRFTGAKSALTVQVWNGTAWTTTRAMAAGTVTVRSDKDISFAANAVSVDTDIFFSYRITDAEGTSAGSDVNVKVRNSVPTLPVAVGNAFSVNEDTTAILNVVGNDTYTGAKSALTVEIWNGSIWTNTRSMAAGTVTVRSDKDLDFVAATVDVDTTVTFDYRITDGSAVSIPANAIDRSSYPSTAAWIAAMNSSGVPGKVGSGIYAFTSRQVLTQSIYGYGTTKPIFKGPGTGNTTRALSFLYPQAPDIRVTGIAFEDINMPFISSDETVDDDWGDALIPMSGYGWNSNEYGLASHRYPTFQNLQIDNCEFRNCGVCVMLVGHFRVHDGLTFTDNVVREGMGCVTVLGYNFRNFDLSRNDIRDMTGSTFGGSSANHTETIFMLGGINNPLEDGYMATNSVTVSNNTVIGFTSSHGQNNKNGAVYLDIRGGGNILSEHNHVENCYSTGGTQDCNAVYLKSRGNIRFRNNLYRNCGAKPVDSAANHGSESQYYTFKGDTTDVLSEDDVFETGAQSGNAPWIQAGTATDITMVRPTFRGWRNDGTWWGRPGVPCMIHHWGGDRFVTVDAVMEDCGWSGTQAYAVAHRDRAGGACSHTGMRANFNNNATAIIGKGSGDATIALTDCQNTIGQNLTLVTGIS